MGRQMIKDDLHADLVAPAVGRTTAQQRSPRTASGTSQPDAALNWRDPERPSGPAGGQDSAAGDQRRLLRQSHSHLRASNSMILFSMTVLPN